MPKSNDSIVEQVWKQYQKGLSFNEQQDLEDTVRTNEDFFIGKQWENVEAGGLPTPVFNFLKRVVLFTVASVVSNNIKLNATAFSANAKKEDVDTMASIVNAEFERVFEQNNLGALVREFMRNAAVDGDGCMYTYWNTDIETGQAVKGAIVTEIIENTRVFFGNPNDRRVQKQPYIIISARDMIDEVKDRAKEYESPDTESITTDSSSVYEKPENVTDDKVTVLLKMWRDKKSKTIHMVETVQSGIVRPEWDTGLTLYPINWLNWDYVQDNYHGQSMISGLIPNQIFVNKLFAMSMISLMTTAYPKIIYDKTRIAKWDNRVGAAIPVNGGDVNNIAKIIDPTAISPQVAQFITLAVEMTKADLGATGAAMGEGTSYNTSAILANQKAASTPSEMTKQNLFQSIEDMGRIYIDFMRECYGKRKVMVPVPPDAVEAAQAVGMQPGAKVPLELDFAELKDAFFTMKLDVGASSYWSEIASIQTMDNLLQIAPTLMASPDGKRLLVEYLRRIPNGYISDQDAFIKTIEGQQTNMPVNGGAGMNSLQVTAQGSPPPNPATMGMQQFKQAAMR